MSRNFHVESPSALLGDAALQETEIKASAQTASVVKAQGAASAEKNHQMGQMEQGRKQAATVEASSGSNTSTSSGFGIVMDAAAEASGLGGVASLLNFTDERLIDHAQSGDVVSASNATGGLIGGADATSFEKMFRSIDSPVRGRTFTEQFLNAGDSMRDMTEITSGMKTAEQHVANLNRECANIISFGPANDKVRVQAQRLLRTQNAPQPNGMGGNGANYTNNAPKLALSNYEPKGPTDKMLTESGEA